MLGGWLPFYSGKLVIKHLICPGIPLGGNPSWFLGHGYGETLWMTWWLEKSLLSYYFDTSPSILYSEPISKVIIFKMSIGVTSKIEKSRGLVVRGWRGEQRPFIGWIQVCSSRSARGLGPGDLSIWWIGFFDRKWPLLFPEKWKSFYHHVIREFKVA